MTQLKSFFDLVNELSMEKDKNLPNLKVPAKGKKGVSKFMRKKAITQMKDAVQSADRKPEKYMKPDGKMGIRMVKTDKEVIKKESIDNHPKVKAARKAHAAGTWDGNVDKEGEAVVHINGKPHTVTNRYGPKKQSNPSRFKPFKKKNEAMSLDQMMRMRYQASASQKKNQKKTDDAEKKKMAAKADMDMRARKEEVSEIVDPMDLRGRPKKRDPYPKSPYGMKHPLHPLNIQKTKEKEAKKAAAKKEEVEVDEALTLQQRMKKSRMMKRMKSRIAVGRRRAAKKMANKDKLEKRANRQARNQIAKKLTRGIPKRELTFSRKQEIEKRLDKPALKMRIKRLAKRMFKDVRKKEVARKKG